MKKENKMVLDPCLVLARGRGALAAALVVTSVIEAWVVPLPLGSSLVVKGRVTSTSSWLWEAPFSLEDSFGEEESLVDSRATSYATSFSFFAALTCLTSLEGLVRGWRALAEVSLLRAGSLGAVLALELEGPDAWMAGG
ncbi:hypothetical protein SO802_015035 [Lithocarpus litseifolius]|uniref:Uncharacterized protein n=1 Tax=Lithocarpus litseifolius TaxID=425828 RepID=A0AAW2CUZ4_9ROSI